MNFSDFKTAQNEKALKYHNICGERVFLVIKDGKDKSY